MTGIVVLECPANMLLYIGCTLEFKVRAETTCFSKKNIKSDYDEYVRRV